METTAVAHPARPDAIADPVRLAAVAGTGLIDGVPSPVLDEITALTMRLLDVRVALLNLVDAASQCSVSRGDGPVAPELRHLPITHSYCRHVVESGEPLVVDDAREHPLLRDNPAVHEYHAVAYAGMPVRSPDGSVLGTLCVFDTETRTWSETDLATLKGLAAAASGEMAARIAVSQERHEAKQQLRWVLDSALEAFVATDATGRVTGWNLQAEQMFGWSEAQALGRPVSELLIVSGQRPSFTRWLTEVVGTRAEGLRGEFQALHEGGRQFPIELSATARDPQDPTAMHAFIRDISAARRSEQLRRLEYAVAGALAAAQSAEHAAEAVVARVGEGLRWPYVEYWHLETNGTEQLVRLADWSRDASVTAPMRTTRAFGREDGVLGAVWRNAAPRWITELPGNDTTRSEAAHAAGLHTAVAVPVRNGTDVVGILAVFDRRDTPADPELVAALESVAAHIGQYVHRRRAVDLELELSRAQRHFDQIVGNLSDFLWTVRITPDGAVRMVYASPNNTGIFGGPAPAGGDLGRAMAGMMHPEDRDTFLEFRESLVTGQTAEVVSRLIGRDGVTRWVWTRGHPRREGGNLFVDGVCSDVTERHRDNARLRQQAELLDLAPTAVIVRDLNHQVTYWNRGAEAVYGWNSAAVLGRRTHRLLDTRYPMSREIVDQALADHGQWQGELDHLRSDGSRIIVLSHQGVQYDDDGQPMAILEVNVDVTARKYAERQLADGAKRLRTQFSLVTVGQAALSLEGRFQQVNPALADILGRTVMDLENGTLDDITHPEDRADNHRTAAYMFTEDQPTGRYVRLLHADGHVVDAEVGMSLVRDSDGQPVSFIAVVQDVTARLAAERERDAAAAQLAERNALLQDTNGQLADANALKLDLMGMLSHEIGTPLNTIGGYADMLLADLDQLVPSHRKAMEVIARSTRRLNQLRAEILTMCTIDAGQLQATPEPVDLAAALTEIAGSLDLSVALHCPDDMTVLVHPSHLHQIITNFCTNAAKYAGGATAITVEQLDDRARISVHDNGPGIPSLLRPHLFDRFTRASGNDPTIQGHGLGLYIVKGLAEANNGSVGYQPGKPAGSTFTLTLPLGSPGL
ncbi:PAS domain S-box-containing protein [Actinoplanes lutulentus]|uniref:histidine kinase n=1 Tax=Actinoplanes lutulentus TaxID=1287878 RepID=A0A327Z5S8_9ACTN|nr:PAS domain S-box protein [Actinoplanes lutulentus]MBB2946971.1 PAS domain S-box-containing protein [Actinoplanes lutulentus]RAK30473.1 PAS domain S-box-containing protein [Actinoplanes lutulentus]